MRTIGEKNKTRQVSLTASGAIGQGHAVYVNSDGTVSSVNNKAITGHYAMSTDHSNCYNIGSDTNLLNTSNNPISKSYGSSVYDSTNKKIVIAYGDNSNSSYGTAVVATISGTTISYGTPVVYNSGDSTVMPNGAVYDSNSNRIVITYANTSPANVMYVVGQVSGTSISFGTADTINSGSDAASSFNPVLNKVVTCFRDGNNHIKGSVLTVDPSDNSITVGAIQTVFANTAAQLSLCYNSQDDRHVLVWRNTAASNIGTSFSFNLIAAAPTSFSNTSSYDTFEAGASGGFRLTYDEAHNKVLVVYYDAGNSDYLTATAGRIQNGSIIWTEDGGNVVVYSGVVDDIATAYDPQAEAIIIAYRDGGDSNRGKFIFAHKNTALSSFAYAYRGTVKYNTSAVSYQHMAFDRDQSTAVLTYQQNYGKSVCFQLDSTPLKKESFIGFANSSASNGDTVTIDTKGGVSDVHSDLAVGQRYFVQRNGTINIDGATYDNVSHADGVDPVEAGMSITTTSLIVKG